MVELQLALYFIHISSYNDSNTATFYCNV